MTKNKNNYKNPNGLVDYLRSGLTTIECIQMNVFISNEIREELEQRKACHLTDRKLIPNWRTKSYCRSA